MISKLEVYTPIMDIPRYGIQLTELSIFSKLSADFERYFTDADVIVLVFDNPEEQLSEQVHYYTMLFFL